MLTEEQKKYRKNGIGGSDMPVIMGLSPWKTPYQLYLEKTDQLPAEESTSQAQHWGNKLEPVILEEFVNRNNVKVTNPGTLVHPHYNFMLGNLDGFIPEWNAVLEIKCSSAFMSSEWGEDGSDNIPLSYLVQVAHYCEVANADCAYIAVLIGGNDYRQFKYVHDNKIGERIICEAQKFWERVLFKTPPPATNQCDLRRMFPKHNPEKTMAISTDVSSQINNLNETRFKIKELSEMEEQYKFNIMQFMGDAECLVDEAGTPLISWKSNKRGSRTFLIK